MRQPVLHLAPNNSNARAQYGSYGSGQTAMRENSLIRPPVSADAQRIRERLGKLIDLLIEEAGSERALGRLTKIGSNSIARWRNQTNWAQLDKLTQFAYSIGWTVTELMEFAESNEDVKQFLERKKFAKKQFSS